MNLYDRYEMMQKEAEYEQIKIAQVETLEKFAEVAEDLLIEQGVEYSPDDVVKVASFLIDAQLEAEEDEEKVASYFEAGAIMANGFLNELGY